jgi:hypothetical protein
MRQLRHGEQLTNFLPATNQKSYAYHQMLKPVLVTSTLLLGIIKITYTAHIDAYTSIKV